MLGQVVEDLDIIFELAYGSQVNSTTNDTYYSNITC